MVYYEGCCLLVAIVGLLYLFHGRGGDAANFIRGVAKGSVTNEAIDKGYALYPHGELPLF
jgi:hypothetical protein